jgi:hypothetical protein
MEKVVTLFCKTFSYCFIIINVKILENVLIFYQLFDVDGNGFLNCISFLYADNLSCLLIEFDNMIKVS